MLINAMALENVFSFQFTCVSITIVLLYVVYVSLSSYMTCNIKLTAARPLLFMRKVWLVLDMETCSQWLILLEFPVSDTASWT